MAKRLCEAVEALQIENLEFGLPAGDVAIGVGVRYRYSRQNRTGRLTDWCNSLTKPCTVPRKVAAIALPSTVRRNTTGW
ncbi:MAG: hypothetical protein U5K38_16120 [Woeseiaceae bacterium]|nr:hypothetical protein [Woeseiaceae bacterium]